MNDTAGSSYVLITFVLPVCLHLDDRPFRLPYKHGAHIEIKTENFFSEKETYLGSGKNVEIESDAFSHFRFTRIRLMLPRFNADETDLTVILEREKNTIFKALNTFIDSVRIAVKRYGLKNFHDYDEFISEVNAAFWDKKSPQQPFIIHQPLGKGLTIAKPLRSKAEHSRIQELINQSIPLAEAFLSDAKRELYYYNDVHALVNAVIALEIRVSDIIRNLAAKKAVDKKDIKEFLHVVGLTVNIKTTLKLLAPEGVALPSKETFQKCAAAITHRNKIMHEGRREISHKEVTELIERIGEMVSFLDKLN